MNNLFVTGEKGNELQLRLNSIVRELEKRIIVKKEALDGFSYMECGYKKGTVMPGVSLLRPFLKGERWGGKADSHAWFYKRVNFPQTPYRTELCVETQKDGWAASNPQFMLYVDGIIKQGMDVNHRSAVITEKGEHDVFVYAYTGTNITDLLEFNVTLKLIDERIERLYYNLFVPAKVLEYTPLGSSEYSDIVLSMNEAINLLDLRDFGSDAFIQSVEKANNYLESEFYGKKCTKSEKRVACIGHTHIDVAWLWTVGQTVEKAQRSFSTVEALMQRYPKYKFMSSQVPLYKAIKEECPELYERIKERVKEGRWEVEGGMYVEPDCNLTGGEGLIRQFLYGKRFFKEEFGVDSKVMWLPDVFGYSAALPQILNKCGINNFVTSKISWNETNTMPYDLFRWKGIDGSETITLFLTAQDHRDSSQDPCRIATYNGTGRPSLIKGAYERYQQKLINKEAVATIGFGDGGGGTTPYDCETIERQGYGIPNQPTAEWKTVTEYLSNVNKIAKENKYTPVWQGELYLEYHRGTYTSQAKNKAGNRRSEFLLQNVEAVSVIGSNFDEDLFDKKAHDEAWETVLLDQFHDILPGSSINAVYEQTKRDYARIEEYGKGVIYAALSALAKRIKGNGYLVYNPNGFNYSGIVEVDGKRIFVNDVPSKGYALVQPQSVKCNGTYSDKTLENDFYKVTFDEKMNIVSIVDKTAFNREILKAGESIRFVAYEDFPRDYDAWEISSYYTEKRYEIDEVLSVTPLIEEDRVGVEVIRRFEKSTITDKVYLYDYEKRIEFDDSVEWHGKHVLLKREFPIDVITDKASCEIQFGYADRPTHKNTSWDWAKFEVCAHKYVDLSEGDYGVALINDCKFGHGLTDEKLTLSLLRAPEYPDADCDKGHHEFKYALLPHNGSLASSEIVKKAYEFNNACFAVKTNGGSGELPASFSAVTAENQRLVIDTLKLAEDGCGAVIRAYEPYRTRGRETLTVGIKAKKAYLCDMLENEIEEIKIVNGKITLDFKPFEIITVKIK